MEGGVYSGDGGYADVGRPHIPISGCLFTYSDEKIR